jgi:hypothetical protein
MFNSQDALRNTEPWSSVASLAAVEPQLNLSDIVSSYTRCGLSSLAQSCTLYQVK